MPTQWEYLVLDFWGLSFSPGPHREQWLFMATLGKDKVNWAKEDSDLLLGPMLDALGENDWELVSLTPVGGKSADREYLKATFKRPKAS